MLLACELLEARVPGAAVPVLVPVSSWNPARELLWHWVARRLAQDYQVAYDKARHLVEERKVIPLLDGLDELPAEQFAAAIGEIAAAVGAGGSFLVTCRTGRYRQAPKPLPGTTAVELRPVGLDDAREFLVNGDTDAAGRWRLVFASPNLPGSALAEALSSPLLVDMARAVYAAGPDPAELLEANSYRTSAEVEHRLLGGFIPAVYRPRARRPEDRWLGRVLFGRPDAAEQWLRFLAGHLNRPGTTGIAWWRLPAMVPGRGFACTVGASTGLLVGLLIAWIVGSRGGIGTGLLLGTVAGLAAGVAGQQAVAVLPEEQPRFLGWGRVAAAPGRAWQYSLTIGIPAAAVGLLMLGQSALRPHAHLNPAMMFLVVTAALAGFGLILAFGAPVALNRAASPSSVLRRDRVTALFTGAVGAMLVGLVLGLPEGPRDGIGCALVVLVGRTLSGASGSYLHARLWLACRRRLPFFLMTFLDDAHQRGVLRQVGAVYEFRHERLQRYLLAAPRLSWQEQE